MMLVHLCCWWDSWKVFAELTIPRDDDAIYLDDSQEEEQVFHKITPYKQVKSLDVNASSPLVEQQ